MLGQMIPASDPKHEVWEILNTGILNERRYFCQDLFPRFEPWTFREVSNIHLDVGAFSTIDNSISRTVFFFLFAHRIYPPFHHLFILVFPLDSLDCSDPCQNNTTQSMLWSRGSCVHTFWRQPTSIVRVSALANSKRIDLVWIHVEPLELPQSSASPLQNVQGFPKAKASRGFPMASQALGLFPEAAGGDLKWGLQLDQGRHGDLYRESTVFDRESAGCMENICF